MKYYDFVVVGSGCAGLTAALELASNGEKVLLIEQHNVPGGCASGFVRGRFEFDPSLHELCSVGSEENPADIRKLIEGYGVKVGWNRVDDCFRVISKYSDGSPMDITLPTGKENFINKMEEYVPGCRESIENMFLLFRELAEGIDYASDDPNSVDVKVLIKKYPNMLRTGRYNCQKVFDALEIPKKAQDILATYWSYLGVDMEHLSFIHYSMMVESYIVNGAYIPTHTSHEISVAMTERFRELGGEIWFNCRAEKFLFECDKCYGVETTMGTVKCKAVLANINPNIIYGKMIPECHIPTREKKLATARGSNLGARMFTAYFGLNKTAEEIGIKDYSIFLPDTADSVKEYESMRRVDSNNYCIFLCYNIANPAFSPEGTCVCSFTTFYSSSEDWDNLSPAEYHKMKTKIAKKFIDRLWEKAGIDIAPYIEEMTVATPMTFARYLNVPEGSVYGFETRDWDGIIARSMGLANDMPIPGLYPIGTSGPRGDGYSSNYTCGKMIAAAALKAFGKGGNK